MSMLDSMFKQRFNAAKCKTLLKLTIPRIKLLRNRRENQLKNMRKEIAKLLETGQEATARIRVEHIIREEKMMAAQEIVELFSELIAVRLPIIEAQRECPLDLKEAISSVCFAAPRCADLPELLQVQMLFAGKYGKEFVAAATELMPECGVNRQLIELLSIRAPAPDVKLKLLKEIAEEHELDWDPNATENELIKPHEDLLNGPTQFVSGSQAPPPKEEKHEETTYTTSEPVRHEHVRHEHSDSDADFDIIDFPEVPKQPLQSSKNTASVPQMLPFPASALSESDENEEPEASRNLSHLEHYEDASPKTTAGPVENKQFLPFISPPSQSSASFSVREHNSPQSSASFSVREHNPPPVSTTKNSNMDLQDILAAAQAAAESAELAAVAARSAASIAQLRISELVNRKSDEISNTTVENPFHVQRSTPDKQNSIGDGGGASTSPSQNDAGENYMSHQPTGHPSYFDPQAAVDSSPPGNNVHSNKQPQRLPSMDEEPYFSYPNLFTSQGSDLSTRSESFKDSK